MLRLRLVFVFLLLAGAAFFARAIVAAEAPTEVPAEAVIAPPAAVSASPDVADATMALAAMTPTNAGDDTDWPLAKNGQDWQFVELTADPEEIARPSAVDTRRAGPARKWRAPDPSAPPPPPQRPLLRPPAV